MTARSLPPAALAAATLALGIGCGDNDSASQAELEQARRQGAAASRRAEAIRELRNEVTALKRQARAAATRPVVVESSQVEDSSQADAGGVPASGTYFGHAEQRGEPAAVNKDYPIEMVFSSTGSSVSYPTLGCDGSLRPLGFDGPDRLYEETIESGKCDNGGVWRVYVESDARLVATWSLPSAEYRVAAILLR